MSQPDCGEDALEIVLTLVRSGSIMVIVVDSVAALVPRAELEGDLEDANVGMHARLMSKAMRRLVGRTAKTGCTIVFINQIREKIGVMFGSPETTTGGRALKFFSSVRLDIRRQEGATGIISKIDGSMIGHQIKIKAVKNKCGVPFKEAIVDLYYASGFDKEASLIEYADLRGLFIKAGAWYSMNLGSVEKPDVVQLAQGLPNLKTILKDKPELLDRVKAKVQNLIDAEAEAAKNESNT